MKVDLVVEEVRERRRKLMEKYGYDVKKIVAMIKEKEQKEKLTDFKKELVGAKK